MLRGSLVSVPADQGDGRPPGETTRDAAAEFLFPGGGVADEDAALVAEWVRLLRGTASFDAFADALELLLGVLTGRRELDRASRVARERVAVCRELEDPDRLLDALFQQAVLRVGDVNRAIELQREHERRCRAIGGEDGRLARSLALRALLQRIAGVYNLARDSLEEARALAAGSGDPDCLEDLEALDAIPTAPPPQ